jgi:hypothetical protein
MMLDVTRQLYNAALQERRDAYRMRGITVTAKMQYAELTALRSPAERIDSRLVSVYRECEDATLRRLDLALQAFFRRVKRGEKAGYPRFRSRSRWQTLQFPHGDRALRLNELQTKVTAPGVGTKRLVARSGSTVESWPSWQRPMANSSRFRRTWMVIVQRSVLRRSGSPDESVAVVVGGRPDCSWLVSTTQQHRRVEISCTSSRAVSSIATTRSRSRSSTSER